MELGINGKGSFFLFLLPIFPRTFPKYREDLGRVSHHPTSELLRAVPNFVNAHLEIFGFPMGAVYQYKDILRGLNLLVRRKQNLASVLGIQNEIRGNHAFFQRL